MPSTPIDPGTDEELVPLRNTAETMLRQLGRATIKGQKITAHLRNAENSVTGYLAGYDDTCWFILQPESAPEQGRQILRQHILRQDGFPHLEIHPERTYDQEPLKGEMDVLIIRFRTWLSRNVFERK